MSKKLIEARKAFEAKRATLTAIFKEAGAERDMEKVTSITGTVEEKREAISKMNDELEVLQGEIKGEMSLDDIASKTLDRFKFAMPDDKPPEEEGAKKGEKDKYGNSLWKGINFGQFTHLAITNPTKLKAMGIDVGEAGGFAIPDEFANRIMSIAPMGAIIRPRAQVIPPGDFPDAKMDIPALRQGAAGVYGGVTFTAANEGTAGTSDDPKLDLVTLEPQRISGYVTVGNSLLRNATSMAAFIENLFRNAKAGFEDLQFIQGPGASLPLGLLNAPCKVNVVRNTAASIKFVDIAGVMAKIYDDGSGSSPIWIASRSALPQIMTLADAMGNSIFIQANITAGLSASLAGYPIFFTWRQPTLGTAGDLMLVDPNAYLIKDGSGPFIQASEHVQFTADQTVIKMTFFLDGQPWVRSPLTLEDGTTASPIVVLQ